MTAVAQDEPTAQTKRETAALTRLAAMTAQIDRARTKVGQLIRERDLEWKRLYAGGAGISQKRIAAVCNVTPDAVYQGIRRAEGRPVPKYDASS